MITVAQVRDIIYDVCSVFGIERYRDGNIEKKEITADRVVIRVQEQNKGEKHWKKGFVEVNLCVPDQNGESDDNRLDELEKIAHEYMDEPDAGQLDGTYYVYSIYSTTPEYDEQMRCHYINVKLLFEVLI